MKLERFFDRFGGSDEVSTRLAAACSAAKVPGAALGFVGEDACYTIATGTDLSGDAFLPTTSLEIGCSVKLFVAAFVSAFMHQGRLALDDEVDLHLPSSRCRGWNALPRGVTLRHLLSHTDGIGYRFFEAAPTDEAGYIDLDALCSIIDSDEPTFRPGLHFSDSPCAFAILGAVLERYFSRTFAFSLRDELLDGLGRGDVDNVDTRAGIRTVKPICPATGRGLTLNVAQLSEFLRFHLNPSVFELPLFDRAPSLSSLYEQQISYPGWSGGMIAACLGWKAYGGGWVGHNGVRDSHSVVLRLQPQVGIGLVCLCLANLPTTYLTLGRILDDLLPELTATTPPRLLNEQERRDMDVARRVGAFGNRARRFVVSRGAESRLEIQISRAENRESTWVCGPLMPATDNIFFVPPPNGGTFFVQYIERSDRPHDVLLWDGWHLWKRYHADPL